MRGDGKRTRMKMSSEEKAAIRIYGALCMTVGTILGLVLGKFIY